MMEPKESKPSVKSDIEKLQQTKRIYRSAQDIIGKLDNVNRHKQPYRVVFERETVELRMKLKDLCERLMFLQPNDFGRKAEELLWWKVYYDVISIIKKNKKSCIEEGRDHIVSIQSPCCLVPGHKTKANHYALREYLLVVVDSSS